MTRPPLTLLIPVYNPRQHIRSLVETITNLTYPDLRLLIIDDGSTDGSAELLKAALPGATIISQPNQGIVGALNAGLAITDTPWLARNDDDDLSAENRLELQTAAIEGNTVLVCGAYRRVRDDGSTIEIRRPPLTDRQLKLALYFDNPIAHGSVLLNKAAVDKAGKYHETCPAEDYDLWVRLADQGSFAAVPEIIYSHIENSRGLSSLKHNEQLLLSTKLRDIYWQRHRPEVWTRPSIKLELELLRQRSPADLRRTYEQDFILNLARLASKFVHYRDYLRAIHQALILVSYFPLRGPATLLSVLRLATKART